MPYNTPVSGTAITVAFHNTNVRDQAVSQFASAAARDAAITAPVAGMVATILSNDVTEGLSFRTSAGTWRLPWNMPWGVVGAATVTASQAGITTTTDLTSLSVAFTAVANRRYKITGQAMATCTASGDSWQLIVADAANTQLNRSLVLMGVTSGLTWTVSHVETITAGSVTRKLRFGRTGGTATATMAATTTETAFIVVEDIGPSGAPT